MKNFVIEQVKNELIKQGLNEGRALYYSIVAGDFYERKGCNSKDLFKDCCDHAGILAQEQVHGFKYKSPKAKVVRRNKRPQEAFNFKG